MVCIRAWLFLWLKNVAPVLRVNHNPYDVNPRSALKLSLLAYSLQLRELLRGAWCALFNQSNWQQAAVCTFLFRGSILLFLFLIVICKINMGYHYHLLPSFTNPQYWRVLIDLHRRLSFEVRVCSQQRQRSKVTVWQAVVMQNENSLRHTEESFLGADKDDAVLDSGVTPLTRG